MRLKAMTIKNFKGIDERGVRIEFAPITLLFGPNNVGKSTVIQALHLARQALCNPHDIDKMESYPYGKDLGTFKDYVHKHEYLDRTVHIGLSFERKDKYINNHYASISSIIKDSYINNYHEDIAPIIGYGKWEESYNLHDYAKYFDIELSINWIKHRSTLSEYTVYINGKKFASLHSRNEFALSRLSIYDIIQFISDADMRNLEVMRDTLMPHLEKSKSTQEARRFFKSDEWKVFLKSCAHAIPSLLRPFANLNVLLKHFGIGTEFLNDLGVFELYVCPFVSSRNLKKIKIQYNDLMKYYQDFESAEFRFFSRQDPHDFVDSFNTIWPLLSEYFNYNTMFLNCLTLTTGSISRNIGFGFDAPFDLMGLSSHISMLHEHDFGHTIADSAKVFSSLFLWPTKLVQNCLDIYVGPLRKTPDRGYKPSQLPPEARWHYSEPLKSSPHWADGLTAWDWMAVVSDEKLAQLNSKLDSLETGFTIKRRQLMRLEKDDPLFDALKRAQRKGLGKEARALLGDFLSQPAEVRLTLRNERNGLELEPHDMGTGISQVLPVVAAAIHGGFVILEQPELHIHPKLQTTLGDIFLEAANNGSMFLLETHSEHLLLRLLKRIRQTHAGNAPEGLTMKHTDLSVYWIGNEGGQTYALRLEVDEDGSFNTPWPEGFFDERGEELFG